jgi:hypothetical protein
MIELISLIPEDRFYLLIRPVWKTFEDDGRI